MTVHNEYFCNDEKCENKKLDLPSIKFEDEPMTKEEIKRENEIVFTGSIDEVQKHLLDFVQSWEKANKENPFIRKLCKHCNHVLKEFGDKRKRLECVNYLCIEYQNLHQFKSKKRQ